MKTRIDYVVFEREGVEACVDAQAISKDGAMVFITASTVQDALALFDEAKEKAEEAMRNWKPEEIVEAPEEPKEHYVCSGMSIEEMAEDAAEYEASPEGQRFTKRLQNAHDFLMKKNKGGLLASELAYLSCKHQNNLINGSMDLYVLGYRLGYRNGKDAAKRS